MIDITTPPARSLTNESVPRTLEVELLLAAWATGLYPLEAAVGLLTAHRMWLRRPDFIAAAVIIETGPADSERYAALDFDAAASFAIEASCASSERRILLIACSLADSSVAGTLTELCTGLDHRNTALVLDAIAHANGWHEHGLTHHTTGWLPRHPVGAAR